MRWLPLLLLPVAVSAQDPFLSGEELQAAIRKDCQDGCMTLNREEVEQLHRNLNAAVKEAREEAYKAGKLACWKAV